MAPNHGGDTIESILGPIGSHWVKKMGQNSKKLPCPKIRFFDYPAVIDFSHKMEVTVMAPNQGGDPLGSILGPVGSHWVQKMGQTVKNYHAPKFEFSITPRSSVFHKKMELTAMAPNHGGDPLGSILGPMGSHWVKKMGQNRKKLPWPKIRIFDYPTVIGFSQKMEGTVMVPNHGGDHLGSILGPHWVQKMCQNRKKFSCPKIRNYRLPRGHRFFAKNRSYGYGAKSRWGHHRVHVFGPMGCHSVQKMGQNRKKLPCPKIRIFEGIDFS